MRAIFPVVIFFAVFYMTPLSAMEPADQYKSVLSTDVMSEKSSFSIALTDRVKLIIKKVPHAKLKNFGWYIDAVRIDDKENSSLIFDRTYGHGPEPKDFLAWISKRRFYPDLREFPVFGEPLMIKAELKESRITGKEEEEEFAAGVIDVSVKKWPWIKAALKGGSIIVEGGGFQPEQNYTLEADVTTPHASVACRDELTKALISSKDGTIKAVITPASECRIFKCGMEKDKWTLDILGKDGKIITSSQPQPCVSPQQKK